MRKITFYFFIILLPFLSFAQITEGFEGATFPPTTQGNWVVLNNGVGTTINWSETTNSAWVISGTKSAIIDRENIGAGNISQDWLISPRFNSPANGQLRFFTKQTFVGNNGSLYEIRVSTDSNQNNLSAYTTLQSWTETTLNTTYNVSEEKTVSLSTYTAGTPIYIAFVKVHNQTAAAISGDRWIIDDVKVVQQCLAPTILGVNTIMPTSTRMTWTSNGSPTNFEIELVRENQAPTGVPTITGVQTNYQYTGLTPATNYLFYVRANCGNGNYSSWTGPFNFTTRPLGATCLEPIVVNTLPYTHTSITNIYGSSLNGPQGSACTATPSNANYLAGNDVFYSYTPSTSGNISVTLNATQTNSSLFVYNGCNNVPTTCMASVANTTAAPRVLPTLAVTAGQTYIFVISSSTNNIAGINYNLIIQQVNCTPPASLTATNIGTTTANLSWSNPSGATSWEVAVQTAGGTIPTGVGTTVNTNTNYTATGLTIASAYQYWVRASCGNGLFSAWSGPFPFNTSICETADRCNYTFRMTDSFSDTWNGGAMQVRQNGVVIATLTGPANNLASFDVIVPICQTLPFQLFWTVAGSFGSEIGVQIINNFNQTIYSKPAGTGSASTTTALFSGTINCAQPLCLPASALAVSNVTDVAATLAWNSVGGTSWDIYVVANGLPAPTATTTPTYSGVTTNPFTITGLTIGTAYQFYVKNNCNTNTSAWSAPFSFNTALCGTTDKCNYTFRMRDQFGDTWNGGIMTVKQNGIIVATLTGPTQANGANPTDVIVPLCDTLPFELNWTNGGSWPAEVAIEVINNFNQSLYNKPFNTGSAPSLLYTSAFDCDVPACLPTTNVTISQIATTTATVAWETGFGNTWDLFVVERGNPAPTSSTVPTYAGVTTNPFNISNLQAYTSYQVYVRTVCSATNRSEWTPATDFTTLPTCAIPTGILFSNVTQYSVEIGWTQPVNPNGSSATLWGIFVVPCGSADPTSSTVPTFTTNSNSFTVSGLNPLSCYNIFVRAICSSTDSSPWSNLITFNTPDVNNECSGSKLATVNQNTNCLQVVSGTLAGATASPNENSCGATADDDDIWFHFVATATTHYVSLFVKSGTGRLNYAVYKGAMCSSLTQVGGCVQANGSVLNDLTVGETYRIRVYSEGTNSSTIEFDLCIGTKIITCPTALPLCAIDPIIIPNNVGVPASPNPVSPYSPIDNNVGCLGSAPSPTFYYLQITQNGNYTFFMEQNTKIDFTGDGLDIDYASWGPFTSTTQACETMTVNNVRANPLGCSYSFLPTETLTINGAQAGEVYVLMITNFTSSQLPGSRGFIRITQTSGPVPTECCPYTNFSYPGSFFCKDSNNITPVIFPGATAGTYSSTPGLNLNTTTGEINLRESTPGFYVITSTIPAGTGIGGCNASVFTWSITISEPATATISYSQTSYCTSDAVEQNVTLTGSQGGVFFATPSGLEINPATGTIKPQASLVGNYTVNYTLNNIPGCNTFNTQTNVTINPVPVARISSSDSDNTICDNETATITVTPTNFNIADATYSWKLNGTNLPDTSNTIVPTQSGRYEAKVIKNGCENVDPLALDFRINPAPVATISSSDPDNTICDNETATITVTPTNFNITNATYSWKLNGTNLPDTANTIVPTQSGRYEAKVILNGCENVNPLVLDFIINPVPVARISSSAPFNTICVNEAATITVTPTNFNVNDASYSWKLNGTNLPDTSNTIVPRESGRYEAKVIKNGCENIDPLALDFRINPLPSFTTNGKCIEKEYIITAVPDNGTFLPSYNFEWSDSNGVIIRDNDKPTLNVTNYVLNNNISYDNFPLTFNIKVTNNLNCSTSKSQLVDSAVCVIAKGISPNGDGDNETLDLRGIEVNQLSIFNRYGTKVYSLANYKNEWRGQTDKGEQLPDGTYYYVIEQKNGETKTGWIYINK